MFIFCFSRKNGTALRTEKQVWINLKNNVSNIKNAMKRSKQNVPKIEFLNKENRGHDSVWISDLNHFYDFISSFSC